MPNRLIAVYPWSFDPLTNGHLDLISRATRVADHLIVAILKNSQKEPLFSTAHRVDMLREATAHLADVEVDSFESLLVDYAARRGANAILRGSRCRARTLRCRRGSSSLRAAKRPWRSTFSRGTRCFAQIALRRRPGSRQRLGERDHAVELVLVAHLAPALVIAVLLAAARVAAGRLEVRVADRGDPYVGVGGRDRQRLMRAISARSVSGCRRGDVAEARAPSDAADPRAGRRSRNGARPAGRLRGVRRRHTLFYPSIDAVDEIAFAAGRPGVRTWPARVAGVRWMTSKPASIRPRRRSAAGGIATIASRRRRSRVGRSRARRVGRRSAPELRRGHVIGIAAEAACCAARRSANPGAARGGRRAPASAGIRSRPSRPATPRIVGAELRMPAAAGETPHVDGLATPAARSVVRKRPPAALP